MKNKTIIDIAKELNIAPSTVSRALNNHPQTNKETKRLVNKVAKRIGYVPNPIARGLRQDWISTIGVIVPVINEDFFSSAIGGIEEVAYRAGFTIIVCQSNDDYEREVLNTQALMNHRVAGILVSISQNTTDSGHFKELMKRNIPLVFFDRACRDLNAYKIVIDDRKSAYTAVEHLINCGYKRIAHFAGPQDLDICKERLQGYKEALKNYNIPFDKKLVCYGGLHKPDGYSSMNKLIKEKIKVDAVFATNDAIALGAFQQVKEAGLKIPKDVAIIGFSDFEVMSLVSPPLTTVRQPSMEMGKRAAGILIDLINDKSKLKTPKTEILDTELIIRKST